MLKMAGKSNTNIPRSTGFITNSLLENIDDLSITTRRNLYASLVSFVKSLGKRGKMLDNIIEKMNTASAESQTQYRTQTKTKKQSVNWVDLPTIQKLFTDLHSHAVKRGLWKKGAENLTFLQRQELQTIVLLGFYGAIEPPPRLELRSVKYVRRKDGQAETKRNIVYRNKGTEYFMKISDTKTTKTYGQFKRKLTPQMSRLLNKYIRALSLKFGDNLFTNNNGGEYSQKAFSRRLQRIFQRHLNKKIGASLLRSIFMSWVHRNTPKISELDELAYKMGHSVQTGLEKYTKKN